MAAAIKKTIQYRFLGDLGPKAPKGSLQSLLVDAMEHSSGDGPLAQSVERREWTQDPEFGTVVLNYVSPKKEFFFGELVRFEPGANLPLLKTAGAAAAYDLTQAKAPDGHEAIRGFLHFLVIGNHLTVLEGGLASSRAERYLTWLLRDVTGHLPKGAQVILEAQLTTDGDGPRLQEVKDVYVRPQPLQQDPGSDLDLEEDEASVTPGFRMKDVIGAKTLDVLRAAGLGDADIESLISDKTEVEVVLHIRFKAERRRQSIQVATASRLLRNVPDDELTLSGPGGRERNGRLMKLTYEARIQALGSLLVTTDVARALLEAYNYFRANGYIDA